MASAKDIRRRIRTVRNIQQMTQAMKLVASARFQQAQQRVIAARPYADKVRQLMTGLAAAGGSFEHPLLQVRPEERVTAIVIGADKGLAGSYHANLVRLAQRFLEGQQGEPRVYVMGKKALGSIRRLGYTIDGVLELPGTSVSFDTVRPLSLDVQQMFAEGKTDAVYLIYTQFHSAISHETLVQRLLPAEPPAQTTGGGGQEDAAAEYLFEPEPGKLLSRLLSRYVDTQLFRAVLESIASEQGARMTAMTSATKNAGEMIDRLTLSLNRARQAAITTEIAEIVGTAEALK